MERNDIQNDRISVFSHCETDNKSVCEEKNVCTQKRESDKDSFSFILVQPYFYWKSYEKPFLIPQSYAHKLEKQHQGNLEDKSRRARKQKLKKPQT